MPKTDFRVSFSEATRTATTRQLTHLPCGNDRKALHGLLYRAQLETSQRLGDRLGKSPDGPHQERILAFLK